MRVEPSPGRGRRFGWEEMLEERVINGGRGGSSWERWESWGLSGGHVLLSGPDILGGGSGKEVRPIRAFGAFDCFEIAQLGEPGQVDRVIREVFLHGAHGLMVFLAQHRQ